MGNPKEGLEKVTIKSTDGSATITHVRYPEGDGTTIVTQTEVNGMKGHTTIHPDDDPHYHHPEKKKWFAWFYIKRNLIFYTFLIMVIVDISNKSDMMRVCFLYDLENGEMTFDILAKEFFSKNCLINKCLNSHESKVFETVNISNWKIDSLWILILSWYERDFINAFDGLLFILRKYENYHTYLKTLLENSIVTLKSREVKLSELIKENLQELEQEITNKILS